MADVQELNVNNTTYDIKAKSIVDNNSGSVKFWTGTKAQYDAIVTKDANTLYNITDDTTTNNFANTDLTNVSDDAKILMSGMSMPSNKYTDLTLGASGSTYTMPADGYLSYILSPQNTNMWFELQGLLGTGSYAGGSTTYGYHGFMPVKKGEVVTISYSNCSTSLLRFIYAVGSESEAS